MLKFLPRVIWEISRRGTWWVLAVGTCWAWDRTSKTKNECRFFGRGLKLPRIVNDVTLGSEWRYSGEWLTLLWKVDVTGKWLTLFWERVCGSGKWMLLWKMIDASLESEWRYSGRWMTLLWKVNDVTLEGKWLDSGVWKVNAVLESEWCSGKWLMLFWKVNIITLENEWHYSKVNDVTLEGEWRYSG